MNLKNYTSSVPMINSINKIEHRLATAGALHIAKSYEGERPTGMIFQIMINQVPTTFKLPAKTDKIFQYLLRQRRSVPTATVKESIRQQADRTAWKILSDWIDINVSLIALDQAEAAEVFLPYAFDGANNQTLFEKIKDGNFKQLTQ